MTYMERMVTIASQTSGVRASELARTVEHYIMRPLLDKIFCVPASSTPVEHVFSHGWVIMRPHRARLRDQMLSALVYLKCNEHVTVYNMTLKSSNVKRRFGYALNFFHRKTEHFWRFFSVFTVLCALCVTRSLSILNLLMTALCCKETQSRSQSRPHLSHYCMKIDLYFSRNHNERI